jgi:flagellin
MGLRINTNLPAQQAVRQLGSANRALQNNLIQLGTGLRINRAADDAAGLAVAESLSTQVRQATAEIGNLQFGISAAQTAEGGLAVQQDATQRLRELALQAANGTLTEGQRAAINAEAQQLVEQVDAIANETQFNGQSLLNQGQTIDLGTTGGGALTLPSTTASDLGIDALNLSTPEGATVALGALDAAQATISESRAGIGAQSSRIAAAINQREEAGLNALESESRIRDLDFARGIIEQTRNRIGLQQGIASLLQGGTTQQTALRLLGQ